MYHTPEYKADTESAFSRGAEKMRMSLISWLMHMNNPAFNDKWKVEDN